MRGLMAVDVDCGGTALLLPHHLGHLLCVNTCILGVRKPTARGVLTLRLVAPGVARRGAPLLAIQVGGYTKARCLVHDFG